MLTVFADASMCPNTLAAGWGAWAKGDGWAQGVILGGPLKGSYVRSSDAEIAALAKAVLTLHEDVSRNAVVMLQSDSTAALSVLATRIPGAVISNHAKGCPLIPAKRSMTDIEKTAVGLLVPVLEGREVRLRHVRGHKSGSGRAWVNRQCDLKARHYMLEVRASRTPVTQGEIDRLLGKKNGPKTATPSTPPKKRNLSSGRDGYMLKQAFRHSDCCSVCGKALSKKTAYAVFVKWVPTLFCEDHFQEKEENT